MFKFKRIKLNKMQIIALGFALLILSGAILLMLPVSSRDHTVTPFLSCLFTATSASCVTGLIMVDTYVHWSLFGQIIIIILIQIGGLGFMTLGVLIAMIMHRRIGLKERNLISESLNAMQIGGIIGFTKRILIGTLAIEGLGAIILSIRFIPEFGLINGIYYGVFHSISAFCNAGFDLMGRFEPFSSLTRYSGDWIVNITIMLLIVIGGIGFLVWDDVYKNKWRFKRYRVHSKIVLIATGTLIFGGALLFAIFERGNVHGMGVGERILTALFDSVSPRTAGFNTTDTAALSESSKLLSIILMFIGGSPGSTAGGIKTTTMVVFALYMRASLMRTRGCNIFNRRIGDDAIKKASAVLCINLALVLGAVMFICTVQPLDLRDVLFETMSAMGTVGMTTGITRSLLPISQLAIIVLMYCGRIGSLSFALSFTEKRRMSPIELPEEKILVG